MIMGHITINQLANAQLSVFPVKDIDKIVKILTTESVRAARVFTREIVQKRIGLLSIDSFIIAGEIVKILKRNVRDNISN